MNKIDKSDFKYFVEDGDIGFNPERNKAIIEGTIKKYEKTVKAKRRSYEDKIMERSDALATYFRSRMAEGSTPVEKYFGKKALTHLRGQRILQRIKRLRDGARVITLEEI